MRALDADGRAALAEPLGAEVVTDDWEAAIAAPGVDAVDICLPTPLHRPVAERALAAGRHVLLEKPIALTLEDADAIGAAAAASGRVLMVGHVLRFFPEVVELRRVLGDRRARARRWPPPRSGCRRPPDWNDWMLDPERSGGTLVDLMIHDFDIVGALLGPARRVHARAAAGGRHVHGARRARGRRGRRSRAATRCRRRIPFTAGLRVLCERRRASSTGSWPAPATRSPTRRRSSPCSRIHPAEAGRATFSSRAATRGRAQIERLPRLRRGAAPSPRDGTLAQARAALAVALAARRSIASGAPEPV